MTPIASTAMADYNQNMPILSIDKVSGGYKSLTASISNKGDVDATNVTWNITINDVTYRFLREIAVSKNGLINVLYAHDGTTELRVDIPKGFGTVKVVLIAEILGVNRFEEHIYAFVLGTRVIILP
jgi:hypothetical protein